MFNLSNHSSLSNMLFATILMLGCVALALPVGDTASSKHDLNHLVSLLGKLNDAHRIRHSSLDSSSNKQRGNVPASSSAMLLRENDVSSDFDTDTDSDDDSTSTVNKRQGAWSFDYGLGGGRFGKRGGYGYLDYGLGGGRFGRDVDHVDPSMDVDSDFDQ